MKVIKRICVVFALLALTACVAQVGPITPVFGGSQNGGYDLQTACSPVMDAAGCTLNTRLANGAVYKEAVVLKDSVQGTITSTVATVGVSKGLDWAIARDIQRNAPDCTGNKCPGGGNVTNVAVNTNAAATADASNAQTSTCPPGGCAPKAAPKKKVYME